MVRRRGRCMASAVTALPLRVEVRLGLLPVRTVEQLDNEFRHFVEAVGIDAPGVGMRARLVEALHPAMAAEEMLGRPCAKAIALEVIPSSLQLKLPMRDHDMQEAGHAAHRAIAVERGNWRFADFRLEADRAAMTAAVDLHAGLVRAALPVGKKKAAPEGAGAALNKLTGTYSPEATVIGAPRLASCRLSARAFANTSTRQARTLFWPVRSTSDAVPQTSNAAVTRR